jgi:hypothetical protein
VHLSWLGELKKAPSGFMLGQTLVADRHLYVRLKTDRYLKKSLRTMPRTKRVCIYKLISSYSSRVRFLGEHPGFLSYKKRTKDVVHNNDIKRNKTNKFGAHNDPHK